MNNWKLIYKEHNMSTIPIPTLQKLILKKIEERGLSRFQLVSDIGYTNISKGCQRLDTFLNTLEAPLEEFITKLISILEIDAVTFYRALTASLDQFSNDAKKNFKSYVEMS